MSVIPIAVIGGIFGLAVMQIPFSVSAAIGFAALFGIPVMDGVGGHRQRDLRVVQVGGAARKTRLSACATSVGLTPAVFFAAT
jgi:Cu/Ag efflux pump CusA